MLQLVAERGLDSVFIDRLQRDLFGSGIDVYHYKHLGSLADELGVPTDRVNAVLRAPRRRVWR